MTLPSAYVRNGIPASEVSWMYAFVYSCASGPQALWKQNQCSSALKGPSENVHIFNKSRVKPPLYIFPIKLFMFHVVYNGCLAEWVMPEGSERLQLSVFTGLSPALLVLKCGHSS